MFLSTYVHSFICVVASSKVEENFTSSAALTEVAAAIF